MTLDYKILSQMNYETQYQLVPGSGYGYYGAGIGGQGAADSYVEVFVPRVLYTVPAGKQTTITSIYVTNRDSVSRTYDLAIVPSGETLSVKHHIRWDMPVGASDFDLVDAKITLSAGDKVFVFPSTVDKIGFTAFGVEKS